MSLVVDASVLVEVLLNTSGGRRARPALTSHEGHLHIPELAVVESISALRGLVRGGEVRPDRAEQALSALRLFPARRWGMDALVGRAWALRQVLTAYDAMYIALAEGLDATFMTMDERLAKAARTVAHCPILVA